MSVLELPTTIIRGAGIALFLSMTDIHFENNSP